MGVVLDHMHLCFNSGIEQHYSGATPMRHTSYAHGMYCLFEHAGAACKEADS
jgi:hypothetical protein